LLDESKYMTKKILVVEDEAHVVSFIKKGLTEEGFEVSVAFDGKSGLQLALNNFFDLIILDIMLPQMNGLDVCNEIRKVNNTVPILFLTALGTAENIVLGLNSGADDYLVKPFKFIELIARIKTLLRRSENTSLPPSNQTESEEFIYKIDNLILNDYTKTVKREDKMISLTSTEYKLLHYFLKNKTKVLSRMDILESVWGIDFDLGTNVVDVYVNYLRKKVDANFEKKLIHTVIGMGYVLKDS
jgi:two-component system, OmpR family, copper resistance phosphate regulon response regulator CusR